MHANRHRSLVSFGSASILLVALLSLQSASVSAETRVPSFRPSTAIASSDWLGEINAYRSASGLAPVTSNPEWVQGLEAHFTYLTKTPPSLMTGAYASVHTENPSSPYYTVAGAQAAASSDLAFFGGSFTPKQAIDEWLDAPFHALAILNPGLHEVAYAATSHMAGLDDADGAAATQPTQVLFPGSGSPTELISEASEVPTPTETCGWQSLSGMGLPIIVEMTSTPSASLTAQLVEPNGRVETASNGQLCVVDQFTYKSSDPVYGPTGLAILQDDRALVLIPRATFVAGKYAVTVTQPGVPTIAWSFNVLTVPTPPTAVKVKSGDNQVTVSWDPPASNGGQPITEYIAVTEGEPQTCTHVVSKGGPDSCTITDLLTVPQEYLANDEFQVMAVNAEGRSQPSNGVPGNPYKITTLPELTLSRSSVPFGAQQETVFSVKVLNHGFATLPTGQVQFFAGTRRVCTATLSNAHGSCTLLPRTLPRGTFTVVADYTGDLRYSPSQSAWATLAIT
jgi:hypothetical protein